MCLDSKDPSATVVKRMLQAISNTESRDPRDASATATILLNLCFSSCREPSTTILLAMYAARTAQSSPQIYSRFCTDPVMALLWQHANNAPRECSDALIASLDATALRDIFGRNVTRCVLRSLLAAYVALCDARAIRCEETFPLISMADFADCTPCSPSCFAAINALSVGDKCFESLWSVQEAIAYVAYETCGDSSACMLVSKCDICE